MTLRAKVPPVVVFAACAGLIYWLSETFPGLAAEFPGRAGIGRAFLVLGFVLGVSGVASFIRAKTSVDPHRIAKASALVTTGVYRLTRNPMYLGLASALLGVAVLLGNPLGVVGIALFVWWIDRFQIAPEEEVLKAKFGKEFEEFARRTRRWL